MDDDEIWADFGRHVKRRRETLQLTIQEAAALAGISQPQWDVVENARRHPFRSRTLRGIESALRWPYGAADRVLAGETVPELHRGPAGDRFVHPSELLAPSDIQLPSGLSRGNERLAREVVHTLLLDDYWGGESSWKVTVLRHLFDSTEASFWSWAIDELRSGAAVTAAQLDLNVEGFDEEPSQLEAVLDSLRSAVGAVEALETVEHVSQSSEQRPAQ